MAITTVAIIGSFRQHYDAVLSAWNVYSNAGLIVTSPKGSSVLEEGIPFVRFESDPPKWNNHLIQTVALHRILRADFVYVVAPHGYVGNTTCYEIGRILQANRPLYFSEHPSDLPINVPDEYIIAAEDVVDKISKNSFVPMALYSDTSSRFKEYECDLIVGNYRDDEYFKL